jgi:hypothetical protein
MLDRLISIKELASVPEAIANSLKKELVGPRIKIALLAVALEYSISDRVIISYNYKKGCTINKYRYVRENIKCSVYCYKDNKNYNYSFLASLALRIEKALIDKLRK